MGKVDVHFVRCENCGASMELLPGREAFTCEYCGSFAFPKPTSDGVVALGEEGELDCPICSTRLATASAAEVRVLYCTNCRGLLAQQEAFSAIVRLLRAQASGEPAPIRPVDRDQLDRETQCPGCGRTMETHPYYGPGNVVIDNCPSCALVWLDCGELAAIRDAPGRDRGRQHDPDYSFISDLLNT